MYEGWILDVYPNYEFDTMNVWLWTHGGPRLITDRFTPSFYVHGSVSELRECARRLSAEAGVCTVDFTERRLHLESDKLYKVLRVSPDRYADFRKLPEKIDLWGRYRKFQLYDVDLRLAQKYMYAKGIFPMALVRVGRTYRLQDDMFSLDYEIPPLESLEFSITVSPGRVYGKSGREMKYASHDEPLSTVHFNAEDGEEWTLESGGDEAELLLELVRTVRERDVDIIYTRNGDEVIFPYLYHRANVNGLLAKFALDRDPQPLAGGVSNGGCEPDDGNGGDTVDAVFTGRPSSRPEHGGKSYFTYGRIAYKPPFYSLKGRLHIDRRSSFIHRESGLYGLVEMARLSCIPLQTMSRLSPGSAISAMQVGQAMRDGVLIKWKKNQPELFKSATELLVADRGGHIFDPKAGVHNNVVELDFVSLYPSIISRMNISPETVLCGCCGDSAAAKRVPGLGYHICEKRRGLIAKVVAPVIARRIAYKHRGGDKNEARQKMLKWVLVTCFGYTGYRNARFGRIECHESITAFARDIMLDAMEIAEDLGYTILHGYVDSLWLRPIDNLHVKAEKPYEHDIPAPAEVVSHAVSRHIGIRLELEGFYKWIVFLPTKTGDVGALTRYYGMFSDGTLKVRGIELRQHSTPPLFVKFQSDILDTFTKAFNVQELYGLLPEVLSVFERYADDIQSGGVDARELVFNARITKTISEYRVFNNQVAALKQLDDAGVEIHPGETVSYVVLNSGSHDPYRRIKLSDFVEGNEDYDRRKYLEFLCRSGESILRPFGFSEDILSDHIADTKQLEIDRFY